MKKQCFWVICAFIYFVVTPSESVTVSRFFFKYDKNVACRPEDGYFRCSNMYFFGPNMCALRSLISRCADKWNGTCTDNEVQGRFGCYQRSTLDYNEPQGRRFLPCHRDEYRCKISGKCIPRSRVKNSKDDCSINLLTKTLIKDMSDEETSLKSCNEKTEFRCRGNSSRCIPREKVMDGRNNCLDGSDEKEALKCNNETEHRCFKNGQCILRYRVNDGFPDCDNDENVTDFSCRDRHEFSCTNKRCIPREWVRNGVKDCITGEDEAATLRKCYETEFQCLDKSRCLPKKYLCDGVQNCVDGSDEVELCQDPGMSRCSDTSQKLIPWSYLLRDSLEKHEVVKFCPKGYKDQFDLLKGFKCQVSYLVDIDQKAKVTQRRMTVPQYYIKKGHSICHNKADQCFDAKGNFNKKCVRCLDGTIISKSQVCDNFVDCPDLSDECPCEITTVSKLCKTILSYPPKELPLNIICNGKKEMKDGIDEKYCDNSVLPSYKPPKDPGLCNGVIDNKSLMDDECSSICYTLLKGPKLEFTNLIKRCFPQLKGKHVFRTRLNEFHYRVTEDSKGEQTFKSLNVSPTNKDKDISIYSSKGIVTVTLQSFQCDNTTCRKKGDIKIQTYNNLNFLCKISGVDCPWMFTCSSSRKPIEIKKRCNLQVDCFDQSDEKNCTTKDHFYCKFEQPLFIKSDKVQNGNYDCLDRSDECFETEFSSPLQMIKNTFLRNFIWVSATVTIAANLIVIIKHVVALRNVTNRKSVQFVNLFLLLNLGFSDILMGIILTVIGIKSEQFSGDYCGADLDWRTSNLCHLIGVFTVVSSQSSINLLVLMTAVRVYVTLYPYKASEIKLRLMFFLTSMCWIIALLFALLPSIDVFFQKVWIEPNIYFDKNIEQLNKILVYKTKTKALMEYNRMISLKSNMTTKNAPLKGLLGQTLILDHSSFADRNIKTNGKFGFYSSSSVCLPNFYSNQSPESHYSFFMISYNLLALLLISAGYVKIFQNTKQSRAKTRIKTDAKQHEGNTKMMIRITMIVASDMMCWLPIIIMSFVSYAGYELSGDVHAVSAIVLLPINCAINPIIYAGLDQVLMERMKQLIDWMRNCCGCQESKEDDKEKIIYQK